MQTNAFVCLDPSRFVSSIVEYMMRIPACWDHVIAELAELNRNGVSAFIAGGAAVEWLLKDGYPGLKWEDPMGLSNERDRREWAEYSNCSNHFNLESGSTTDGPKELRQRNFAKFPDVDVFIKRGVEFGSVETDPGALENLGISRGHKHRRIPLRKQFSVMDKSSRVHYRLLDMITINSDYMHPVSDVLCMFDLVCCCVAFVPHPVHPTVMWYPEAIRALSSKVVHVGSVPLAYKTYVRFCKYRYRLKLHPSISHPHDLRMYHTQCVAGVCEPDAPRPYIEFNPGCGDYCEGSLEGETFPLKTDAGKFGFEMNGDKYEYTHE